MTNIMITNMVNLVKVTGIKYFNKMRNFDKIFYKMRNFLLKSKELFKVFYKPANLKENSFLI